MQVRINTTHQGTIYTAGDEQLTFGRYAERFTAARAGTAVDGREAGDMIRRLLAPTNQFICGERAGTA